MEAGLALDQIELGDTLTYLRELPDCTVDLVVSSPPYNIGKEYESRQQLQTYLDQQRLVLEECVRVLKSSGSIFWQVGSYALNGVLIPLDIRFFPILEDLGLQPRNRIVWVRQHGLHARRKFSARHETILWFTKSDNYKFALDPIRVPQKYQNKKSWRGANKGELTCHPLGKNPGDIWIFQNVKHNHEEQTLHPAQFPEDLIARIVLATTDEGDVVLDPYMGSGTVAVVARDFGRRYLGAELDQEYHSIAIRRLSGLPDEHGVFPNLKTLRDYAEATGQPASDFTFDVQSGQAASDRSKARRYSEEHHLAELEVRLAEEEAAFSERVRGTTHEQVRRTPVAALAPPSLFDSDLSDVSGVAG
ncbi:MAG TPA: site-specific DNA-methyltransferase [Mycobacteriales bacterium]|jgi:adenine-specific DNA-methyltransferase|nr:site-specific DNA-methyltransferase [Mycobacteriales bacterium]